MVVVAVKIVEEVTILLVFEISATDFHRMDSQKESHIRLQVSSFQASVRVNGSFAHAVSAKVSSWSEPPRSNDSARRRRPKGMSVSVQSSSSGGG